jgi:hypothetical protein
LGDCPSVLPLDESLDSLDAIEINALAIRAIDNLAFEQQRKVRVATRQVDGKVRTFLDVLSVVAHALTAADHTGDDLPEELLNVSHSVEPCLQQGVEFDLMLFHQCAAVFAN